MLFNSLTFLLFFAIILLVHYSPLAWRLKKTSLLLGSYVFYAAWNPPFVLLLCLSTLVDWLVAKKIYQAKDDSKRKYWLWISLFVNLGMLAVFKYSGFLLNNFNYLLEGLGISIRFADPGLILPVGISFFTFQTLSYTFDIYYRKKKPWNGFLDYALYVSFFPQLVAGPIVRARYFLPQTSKQNRINFATFSIGLSLLIIGLFEKTVLADTLFAPIADKVFDAGVNPDFGSAWMAALMFSAQIFCDFSGYSLAAIGCALCLGFKLPINFRSPFAAMGFSDFWRRWHISLSSWLRDYLYIPLGGNRKGQWKTIRNLMITMLLGGLWHGAAWTFVAWGLLHGSYLIAERGLKKIKFLQTWTDYKLGRLFVITLTFLMVTLAFVVFRAESFSQAVAMISAMFVPAAGVNIIRWNLWSKIVMLSFMVLLLLQWFYRDRLLGDVLERMPVILRSLLLSFCLIMIVVSSGNSDAFIYFQF